MNILKTLSIGAITTLNSISHPYFTSLYIAPLSTQTSRFSTTYLGPFLDSPLVKKYYRDSGSKKNVFERTLNNGSIIFLSYAQDESDADRTRGCASDCVSFDEVQDISMDAIPIIAESLSASNYGLQRFYGTAKGESNTLELLYKRGSGSEWCVKCEHCGKWVIPWTFEDCIKICSNETGTVCNHCAKPIDFLNGRWISSRPQIEDKLSFHIPRFILEARTNPRKWRDLQSAIGNPAYTPAKLANEVFGLAAGIAGRILSQKEAMLCCNPSKLEFDKCWPMDSRGINSVVLGVDWSVTGGAASYTVASVLGYDFTGKCYLLYSERMNGIDILEQVKRVEQLFRQFNCQMMASDRGVGVLQGQLLQQALGIDRCLMVNYVAAKVHLRYDRQGQFMAADRTQAMDSVILKAKIGRDKFETPSWEIMSTFWNDALALFEEETQSGRRVYRKDEGSTDDWLHSVSFGHVAYMCLTGQYSYLDMLD